MAEIERKWTPSELNDAARLIWLAERLGAETLDDLKSFRTMSGRSLVPELKGDVLDHIGRVIEADAKGRPMFCGDSSQHGQNPE